MNKYIISVGLITFLVFLSGTAFGHGMANDGEASMGMMRTMDLMHDQLDANNQIKCEQMSDSQMMEEGEEMMEKMMGHEDHERMEASLNEEDHDSMHMMMGAWSSGCIGDEAVNTLAYRYGYDNVNHPMMVNGWGYFGGGNFVTTILVWILLVMAIMALWQWLKSNKKTPPVL